MITEATTNYEAFLDAKAQLAHGDGIHPAPALSSALFPFQTHLVEWALERGRAAIFADCGLGKTPMQLEWARCIAEVSGKPVLLLTPLAVSYQTLLEAQKFGIEATRSQDGTARYPITVTNYERLHHFNPDDFAGVVCDESSILKSFDGSTRKALTVFMRKISYRLLCTATAAPNDYFELGTSSEALGHLGATDMMARFFTNGQQFRNRAQAKRGYHGGAATEWRFKGHAEIPFWRWVCSWARAIRKPSDLGFEDEGFILPPLSVSEHVVKANRPAPGMLFELPAIGLYEQREERRRTLQERCEEAARRVADTGQPALVWCHLNDEADLIERLVPDAVQIKGPDSDEVKEERFLAFTRGQIRVLVTKPVIGAWGLNFQHCAHVVMFPSHSYEQYYQAVRRCWRFGQQHPVNVDLVITEGEQQVMQNLQRKALAADRMFTNLVAEMNHSMSIDRGREFGQTEELPSWL